MGKLTLSQLERELEAYVDSNTLANVLDALARVCADKAEHLRSNWQAPRDGSLWDRAARRLATLELAAQKDGL